MLNLEHKELSKVAGRYTGKLFKVIDDFKYEVEAQTSLTFDESNNLHLEIFMDGCGSGEMCLLTKEVNNDVFEVCCDDADEHLSGKIDAYNKMLSFKVESPRSGETEFVGCL